jgi:hypothetical protein
MERNIAWKDLLSLPRYQRQLIYLENDLRLIYTPGLISSALLSIIMPSSGFCTAVHPLGSGPFPMVAGQLYHPAASLSARLNFLAPRDLESPRDFEGVLSYLIARAGERGAVQILAEIPQNGFEEDILTQAGFRTYAEQQIWKLPQRISSANSGNITWEPIEERDVQGAISIYQRIIPGAVQRVEPPPTFPKADGMICWDDGDVVGFAETKFGPRGILVDLILEPGIPNLDQCLYQLFSQIPFQNTKIIYIRTRSYQERIASALESTGAMPGPNQIAVVKRLAVHYNAKQTFSYQGFEKQPDITTPISNTKIKN